MEGLVVETEAHATQKPYCRKYFFKYIFVFFLIRRLFYVLSSYVCDGDKNEQKIHSKICR